MIRWGWTGMSHDASLAVFVDDEIVFAAHSERYSRIKNDKHLNDDIIKEALAFGHPDKIYFYENPLLKKTRQLYSKQYNLLKKQSPQSYIESFGVKPRKGHYITTHHKSHAAGGFYTSPFDDATVLVIDSIGEWDTVSIWNAKGKSLKKKHSQQYPHSVGIWYSAMTQRLGLKPQEHEYILMGMAAFGNPNTFYNDIKTDFFKSMPSDSNPSVIFKRNCHRGCLDWRPDLNTVQNYVDIAAAVQKIYEEIFSKIISYIARHPRDFPSQNLVIMGGCALNCVANTQASKWFNDIWIMPNPGDAGSCVGSVLAHTKKRTTLDNMFLGHDIKGEYPVGELLDALLTDKVTAVASGKAEFGPRALGNRSILADPRGSSVKDRVNAIKHREEFRPFAPIILEEHVNDYFEGVTGRYMQYTSICKKPDEFPAIVHSDNSSRVQTVPDDGSGIRRLLEAWYEKTGCPMLLNTSLNIKGEPLVNTRHDAVRWTEQYGVNVCLPR